MKRHPFALSIAAIALAALPFTSCTTESGFTVGTCTATINSRPWVATAPVAVKTGNRFTITATSLTPASSIVMHINGITPGTYNMNVFSTNIQPFVYMPDVTKPRETYIGTFGTITLTRVTEDRVSGTFDVNATSTTLQMIHISGSFADVIYHL